MLGYSPADYTTISIMETFNFVIFGFSGNLAQLKIIPALYDLEAKKLLSNQTKIIGVGRKTIDLDAYLTQVLTAVNRHHQHPIDPVVKKRLQAKCVYIGEDLEGNNLYKKLRDYRGNTLFYLATYPDLYSGIFQNLKLSNLNRSDSGWVKIMVEKPIGHDYASARGLNSLLAEYFEEQNIFRVDHYLGKKDLYDIFKMDIPAEDLDSIQLSVLEDFGIGKRGVYYDATGALVDMGQNHFMQMLSAVMAQELSVAAREKIIRSLIPQKENLVLGQYDGYLSEDNVAKNSNTETFFALKTFSTIAAWKNIPIYMRSGKQLNQSVVKIALIYKDGKVFSKIITSTGAGNVYDPYEKLILEAVRGNRFYFNSAAEVEASWKFIDALKSKNTRPLPYRAGSSGPASASVLMQNDARNWV